MLARLSAFALALLMGCATDGDVADPIGDDGGGKGDDGTTELMPLPDVLVVGHRGAPWSAVENTLPAFTAAVREGANMIETDVCVTKDGVVVVWHDCDPNTTVSLARQAGAEGLPFMPWVPNLGSAWRKNVEELTLAELRAHYDYQVAKGFTSSVFTNGQRIGAVIPTLEDFVAWSRTSDGRGMRAVFVDVKLADGQRDLARTMAAELLRLTADTRYHVFIGSPHEAIVDEMRAFITARPHRAGFHFMWDHEKKGALANSIRGNYDAISMGKTVLRGWDSFVEEVDEVVAGAPAAGIDPVIVWTFDDDDRMMAMLDAGVDGILTNRPADLTRLVQRGWTDHDGAIAAITACAQANAGRTTDETCANPLSLAAPLRKAQVFARACSGSDRAVRDLFGCGGLFDAVEVRFDDDLRSSSTLRWDGDDEVVVVAP